MTVAELIELLKKQPQDLQVIYSCCSEQCLLQESDTHIVTECVARPDGWVQNNRGDKPTQEYLLIV